jgi:hypothetical protein
MSQSQWLRRASRGTCFSKIENSTPKGVVIVSSAGHKEVWLDASATSVYYATKPRRHRLCLLDIYRSASCIGSCTMDCTRSTRNSFSISVCAATVMEARIKTAPKSHFVCDITTTTDAQWTAHNFGSAIERFGVRSLLIVQVRLEGGVLKEEQPAALGEKDTTLSLFTASCEASFRYSVISFSLHRSPTQVSKTNKH